jgi:hypothetical protein
MNFKTDHPKTRKFFDIILFEKENIIFNCCLTEYNITKSNNKENDIETWLPDDIIEALNKIYLNPKKETKNLISSR